jgi:peptidoglycan/LPS O-acetylase OafA/YrhL
MAVACAVLLALVVLPHPRVRFRTPIVRFLDSRVLTAVGVASYSLFLWHESVSFWLRRNGLTTDGWLGLLSNLLIVGAVSGVLSALTYHFIERPTLRRRLPWAGRQSTAPQPSREQSREEVHAAP